MDAWNSVTEQEDDGPRTVRDSKDLMRTRSGPKHFHSKNVVGFERLGGGKTKYGCRVDQVFTHSCVVNVETESCWGILLHKLPLGASQEYLQSLATQKKAAQELEAQAAMQDQVTMQKYMCLACTENWRACMHAAGLLLSCNMQTTEGMLGHALLTGWVAHAGKLLF